MKRWGNLTGMIGDMGVLLPLLVGLSVVNGMNFPVMLGLVGVSYVGTAVFFRVPVPIQPFKVACVLALAQGFSPDVIQAAALWMSVLLLFLGQTRLIDGFHSFISKPLIRGLQLGVGLLLMKKGFLWLSSGLLLPAAPVLETGSVWSLAFFGLVIPQLPLTLTNAALGSADTGRDYFRWMAKKVRPGSLCTSMGLINLMMGLLGGLPTCHGSSGWTAHRRLGARSYGSTLFLGSVLVLTAVFWGERSLELVSQIPHGFLSALLIYVGLRHALLVTDQKGPHLAVALIVGLISFAGANAALGLGFGLVLQLGRRLFHRMKGVSYVDAHQ